MQPSRNRYEVEFRINRAAIEVKETAGALRPHIRSNPRRPYWLAERHREGRPLRSVEVDSRFQPVDEQALTVSDPAYGMPCGYRPGLYQPPVAFSFRTFDSGSPEG
jgi:hypothetical protein